MKKLALTLFVLIFSSTQAAYDVDLICESSFDGQVFNLMTEKSATCLSDFIWGKKGVCYEGNSETLVKLMNDEYFDSQSLSVAEAVLNQDGSISYVGYDQMSFWAADRTIYECGTVE